MGLIIDSFAGGGGDKKQIARVFPTKTKSSPDDNLAFFDIPPLLTMPEVDEVHISVAFTWDLKKAEWLEKQWRAVGVPVKMGGPAFNEPGGEFIPGMYLKKGYTITSRGCPNHCEFCSVPKREGGLRELKVNNGWNVLDDNLLACSDDHIRKVFNMLSKQTRKPEFTGGLEAHLLKQWHCEEFVKLKARRLYFAYDMPSRYEALVHAGKMLRDAGFDTGFTQHSACCYVLIGYKDDTFDAAESRLTQAIKAGFFPYAMLYRDFTGETKQDWRKFQREWLRADIVGSKILKIRNGGIL